MNVLILGDGPEELSWAYRLREHPEHRLVAACPGFKSMPDLPGGNDLDAALALAGLDAVICGGAPALRAEGLRRAASTGMKAVALHPPGPNADPYYQVALSRQENGAIVVPDLPARLHPAMDLLAKAVADGLAAGRESVMVSYEVTVGSADGDLLGQILPRMIDPVRALIGEVQAVTATGVPPGEHPTSRLTVHLRGERGIPAEIAISVGPVESARLSVASADRRTSLIHDMAFSGPGRLVRQSAAEGETSVEIGSWDAATAILRVLDEAHADHEPSPGLTDGTRAMEVAEAAARSLRRGRTIDLHYEEMSEVGNFKSVMTSMGCGLILLTMVLLFVAAAADGLGFAKLTYIAWIIPPVLVVFVLFQLFRFGIKTPPPQAKKSD